MTGKREPCEKEPPLIIIGDTHLLLISRNSEQGVRVYRNCEVLDTKLIYIFSNLTKNSYHTD